jgi:uncharacterized protein (DUF1501 family)
MLDILFGRADRRCDGVSRRDFLRIGAMGSLGLGGLLSGQAQAAHGRNKARAKSVILVYLGGGLSHHDSFDPKPDAPAEVRGNYKPISTNVTGLHITEMLPRMSRVMSKIALVRSGAHNNDHHETATNWVMSGRFGSAFGDYPAMGAVVAHESGFRGQLPPYVAIPRNPSFTWELGKSAYLGGRYESFKTGDPNAPSFKVQDVSPIDPVTAKSAARRKSLLAAVDDVMRKVEGNDLLATYDEFHRRAAAMILSKEARGAFDMEQESNRLRDRYGRNTFGQSCLLARRLVERGVRFVTVNFGGWDHHAKIWDGLKNKLPELDAGFSALIEDMAERGLLKDTLVLCMGEFGRTPKINKDAGRDHWAPAAALLFAGAGVKAGLVLGATDKQGAYATRRPVAPGDVAATVFEALGIDPHKMLAAPDGRPIEILDKGEAVKELFA